MSEIKDRQDAASDIDPIVAALADDTLAAAAVEGFDEAAEPEAEAEPSATGDAPADETPAAEAIATDLADDEAGADVIALGATPEAEAERPDPQPAEAAPLPEDAGFVLGDDALELAADDFGDAAPAGDAAAAELATRADLAGAIEAALMADAPDGAIPAELVAEALDTTSFEHMPAAYADTIVELDDETEAADDDSPLLDSDLEDGIASVFAALHAATADSAPVEPLGDLEAAEGVTFRLLGELDRLWHRAA